MTSSTVNVNDTALLLPLEVNATYTVSGLLLYSAHQDGDIRIGWSGPSAATFQWICHAQNAGGTSGISTGVVVDLQNIGAGTFPLGGADTGNTTVMTGLLAGRVVTSATAGNLQLNWAQRVSHATSSIMRAGSWIQAQRVA
ncbi:hypothetical protein [Streptomyces sp. NPDC048340]|uniref:hypothetical protein n=1 Tax=Streptomyces sp. NPDC048340 TaxID=3365537 RepID=UPI003720753B